MQSDGLDADFIPFTSDSQPNQFNHPGRVQIPESSLKQELVYAPWLTPATASIRNPNVRLHNEIIEFSQFIQPSDRDVALRTKAVDE
jgi:hypothetical protein